MDKRKDEAVMEALADVVTSRPHEIEIGGKRLRLYPLTLAKTFLLRAPTDALGVDRGLLLRDPYLECLRLAETRREVVAEILAIHSAPNTYRALHDSQGRGTRRDLFARVKTEHLAGLLMIVLTSDKTEELSEALGLREDHERLVEIMKVKGAGDKNNLSFGGKSLFGAFIGQLKGMGYSDEEIVFERGYSYLRLMLADKVTNVYLSDEELSSIPRSMGGTLLDGEDDGDLDVLAAKIRGLDDWTI